MKQSDQKRDKILQLVKEYYSEAFPAQTFVPGKSVVRYAGRVFDADELVNAVDASLDFWLTAGRFSEDMEANLANLLDIDTAFLVNTGSSANLVAIIVGKSANPAR